jgi:hypothetical protein
VQECSICCGTRPAAFEERGSGRLQIVLHHSRTECVWLRFIFSNAAKSSTVRISFSKSIYLLQWNEVIGV